MPDLYIGSDGKEISYEELVCKCGSKANQMYDEADTLLLCDCGEIYFHKIWDLDEGN
ncbi:hypothetical protein [Paenibacillus polymyxa]|uniref:hypothetical protein n=1 Tax=Paenibacillus polymyxa TaxID=1406 RepID=UPI0003010259|nr:hypothetical protein [Paenibacillus polymyxa]